MSGSRVGQPSCAARRPLRVAFVPQYPENPYQSLLVAGLHDCQVDVAQYSIGNFSARRRPLPDVLHLHWLHPFCTARSKTKSLLRLGRLLFQWLALRLRGVKIVWTVHNLHDHANRQPKLDRFLTSFVARRADSIIVHSRSAATALQSTVPGVEAAKVHVVPHGNYIDSYPNDQRPEAARSELELDPDALVVLFLGAVRRYKGIDDLLSAWRQLPTKFGRQLVIAGAPGDAATDELVRRVATDSSVIRYLPGLVPDERIQTFMNAADVVVLPYRETLTSGALVLAMSFGKAVIVPALPLFRDLLDESQAIFYSPGDASALGAAIEQAAQSKDRLSEMGAANRRLAEQWSWPRVAAMTRSVYDACLGDTSGTLGADLEPCVGAALGGSSAEH